MLSQPSLRQLLNSIFALPRCVVVHAMGEVGSKVSDITQGAWYRLCYIGLCRELACEWYHAGCGPCSRAMSQIFSQLVSV